MHSYESLARRWLIWRRPLLARRYDYYQTDTSVNLSVFVKGLTEADVDVTFGDHSVSRARRTLLS